MVAYRTKSEAEAEAKKWRDTLPGSPRKWKLEVWENLGWHWAYHLGPISVHYSTIFGKKPFSVLIASDVDQSSHGRGVWTPSGGSYASTAAKAVELALAEYRRYAESERQCLDRMDEFFTSNL